MRFLTLLSTLSASLSSSQKAAQFALKYRDMDEDLHSCILESLEKNSMNNRANILYFLDALVDMTRESDASGLGAKGMGGMEGAGAAMYVRMIQRDVGRIVDALVPPSEEGISDGGVNLKVVRKVLDGWVDKEVLSRQTVDEINELLQERDAGMAGIEVASSPVKANGDADDVSMKDAGTADYMASRYRSASISGTQFLPDANSATPPLPDGAKERVIDKRAIEQRIEEDRERHKRLREQQWAVPNRTEDEEFERLWDETSELGSDDFIVFDEEAVEREGCARAHAEEIEERGET